MNLYIENFAKIANANINIDGITVIAGENNTGKSTIGKILFAVFNALKEMDKKVVDGKLRTIRGEFIKKIYEYDNDDEDIYSRYIITEFSNDIYKQFKELIEIQDYPSKDIIENRIKNIVNQVLTETKLNEKVDVNVLTEMTSKILKIVQLPNDEIACGEITNFFADVFNNQINSLNKTDEDSSFAKVLLNIKNKDIVLEFENEKCKNFKRDINIIKKAVYIDNPFIIDEIDNSKIFRRRIRNNKPNDFLRYLISNVKEENQHKEVVNNILAQKKLDEIMGLLEKVISGNIYVESGDKFYIENSLYTKGISIKNISTGLKSFAILKMLIENSVLIEKDVLVLDEPEIHLHPQWQVIYAELIVLLQKHFDLSIVVTTHSPYFLDAIDLFSIKHGIKDKMNFYLSENKENGAMFRNVNENIELIYDKMATPLSVLETLRLELGQ